MNLPTNSKALYTKSKLLEHLYMTYVKIVNSRDSKYDIEERMLSESEILALYPLNYTFNMDSIKSPPIKWHGKKKWKGLEKQYFSLPSAYTPISLFENSYLNFPENHTIHGVRFHRPLVKSPIALIYCHGWSERDNYLIKQLIPAILAKNPFLDIFAKQLPHHMKRKPKQSGFSGSFFLDGNVLRNIEASRQAAYEVSQLISALENQYEKILLVGTSLGGHVVSYVATFDSRADGYVMGLAGANAPSYFHKLTIAPCFQRRIARMKIAKEEIERLYEPLRLTRYKPIVPGNKIAVVAGKYDMVVPFASSLELEQFFSAKYQGYFQGGHFSFSLYGEHLAEQISQLIKNF